MSNVEIGDAAEQDRRIMEAAHAYADALAVLRGKPPFSAWDALKITLTQNRLLAEVVALAAERDPGPSIPANGPAPPELKALMKYLPPR